MKVVIAEKPSVGKAVAKFFGAKTAGNGCITGDGVIVTWCFGHLFELAKPLEYGEKFKEWHMDKLPLIPNPWIILRKESAEKQLKIIEKVLSGATEIVHAGDPDREGQLLVDEVLQHFKKDRLPVKRLWLAALDDESIGKAVSSMKDGRDYRNISISAEARAKADWSVGMSMSRAWQIKVQQSGSNRKISVGRVRTPTMAMVVKRDLEIDNFKSVNFFTIMGNFPFPANWKPNSERGLDSEGRLIDGNFAKQIADKIKGKNASVLKYDSEKCKTAPPLLYSLSELQMVASAKFGFGAKETLDIAQSLYETHKVTSYPRTDCRYLPLSMHANAVDVLRSLPKNYQGIVDQANARLKSSVFDDSKITAHHAIIPTKVSPEGLNDKEAKLYDLIVKSYLSQFYSDYLYQQVNVVIGCEGEIFAASGRTPLEVGWKQVLGQELDEDEDSDKDDENMTLPILKVGDSLICVKSEVKNKKTKPPARYTEGILIKAMTKVADLVTDVEIKKRLKDTAGIGTEATRAGIIESLIKTGMFEKSGKKLISSATARDLIAALGDSQLSDPGTTGIFEGYLDNIAQGNLSLEQFMKMINDNISEQVAQVKLAPKIAMSDPTIEKTSKYPASSGKPKSTASATSDKGNVLLNVPFEDKGKAKELGARWDGEKKSWFMPKGLNIDLFKKWKK